MQFGIMDHLVPASDETASFLLARDLGFAGVECGVARADLLDDTRARLGRLKAAQQASGLQIPSLALHHHNSGGIGSSDPEVAAAAHEDLRHAIEWAAGLGAQVILVPFFGPAQLNAPDQIARTAAAFGELCPLAAQHGVRLCFEGTLSAAAIRSMAEQVGSPAFGCYFDLANVVWLGMDTAAEIRGLGALIHQVHMKEYRSDDGIPRPGTGKVNYAASAEALREIGYDAWMVLETPAGPPEQVAEDFAFTKRFFA
jgi:sugar phosphate isomerase/epimerase